jgi:hypothetical protein
MRCAAPSGASRLPSGSTSATGTGTASWTPGWAPSTWRSRSCVTKGRLEEGDQFLGDGFGFEQWGKVTDAWQLSDVRVDDVLGHVAFHVGEEGAE